MIVDLGKFEGEPDYAPYFWEFVMMGDGETIYDGDTPISLLGVDPADVTKFPELDGVDVIAVWEDSQGFVYVRELTQRQADNFTTECAATEGSE